MAKICCVCGREIIGNRHPSPEGVFLCGEHCYQKWKLIVTLTLEIKKLARIQPENAEDEIQHQRLENTVGWVERYEKRKAIEYIE